MGSSPAEVERLKDECKQLGATPEQCKGWYEREAPRHRVHLDAFCIDRYEVRGCTLRSNSHAGVGASARVHEFSNAPTILSVSGPCPAGR